MDRNQIHTLVTSCIENLLNQKRERSSSVSISELTSLIGSESVLDSLDLVELTLELEEKVKEKFKISLNLTNDNAMSQKNSPFQTVKSLTDYIYFLTQKDGKCGRT